MEKLNSDEKMLVVMKLDPKEVLIVCETSKDMNSVCKNSKYDLLWQNKIKEDFNVKDQGSYEKYKFTKQLYDKKFYTVSLINSDYIGDSSEAVFDSEEKAEKFIYSRISGNFSYSAMKSALNTRTLKYGGITYQIEEVRMYKEKIEHYDNVFNREKEEYEKNGEILKQIHQDILAVIEDCVTDFNSDFAGANISSMPTAKSKIRSYIKELDEDFELGDNRETIKNLIIDNLFVDFKTKELLRK